MRTLKTLKPGQRGTKELLARYGTSLLCVRYRYDEATGQRLKTVELIVQRGSRSRAAGKIPPSAARPVPLRIHWRETELRTRVKSAGARWDPERQVWWLRRDQAVSLGLLERVVGR